MRRVDRLFQALSQDIILDWEFVREFVGMILSGEVDTIQGLPKIPEKIGPMLSRTITMIEANGYVDLYPFQRSTVEERREISRKILGQIKQIFSELRHQIGEGENG